MISLAFSPCPNDTFIFHALVHGCTDTFGVDFKPPVLADVETLNDRALHHKYDVTKLSFHAYGHVTDQYQLLHAGAALGRGCGPLLISRDGLIDFKTAVIAIPGELTTAAMLLQLFADQPITVKAMGFDSIMTAISQGDVDAGVIIHESRFTYEDSGLKCVQDLGNWWEDYSGFHIPLGGIVARKSLGQDMISRIEKAILASIKYAYDNPRESLPYIHRNAQETAHDVVTSHIKLYVNSFSEHLGEEGLAAINFLLKLGRQRNLF
jgi:1,4-dihydroxy-6-naphthoate synthase